MIYSVKYTPEALETFDKIIEQLSIRWGDKYVDEFKTRTLSVIETIRTSPFIFQAIEFRKDVRKGFIHKNCSMFYRTFDYQIEILFFWDNRQDPIFK